MISTDTIIALSSSPAVAARAIVRLSGSLSKEIAGQLTEKLPEPGKAIRCPIHIGSWRIPATIYFFAHPRSYTGEDLVEFHLPGNSLLCDYLIRQCVSKGARLAEPGEFTARAYFNGKMDLTQAEGVAATISAMNQQQLAAARQLLAGELARRLAPITESVAEILALVEAGIDFVDEDIRFISQKDLADRLVLIDHALRDLVNQSARFAPAGTEPTVALIGRPNAGKSTLLNALARQERAIVSPIAGTTRDALSAEVMLDHGIVKLMDIAGIEETPQMTEIDRQMQSHARRAAQSADINISVTESLDARLPVDLGRAPDLRVRTKMDLGANLQPGEIGICALTGMGLDRLRADLDRRAFGDAGIGEMLALNTRHVQSITDARSALRRACAEPAAGHEFTALHLRECLDHLGQITGTISPDELLGKIFSQFCIGK